MSAPPPYPGQGPPPGAYPPPQDYKPPEPGYPPQPVTGYSTGATATTTTVVMQPTTVVHAMGSFGPYPANISCPSCRAQVVTSMSYSDGLMVWLVAGGLCIVGLWLGCCLIPFCINDLKDVTHSCPNCGTVVGHHKRI